MNVEIGAEAELFPEKEYKNGIAFAVRWTQSRQSAKLFLQSSELGLPQPRRRTSYDEVKYGISVSLTVFSYEYENDTGQKVN